jgi:hypothetical protein
MAVAKAIGGISFRVVKWALGLKDHKREGIAFRIGKRSFDSKKWILRPCEKVDRVFKKSRSTIPWK